MASRFWVGGTGTWDASDTTHWAASTGGAGGQSVPGSADTVTFDASSGGGTVTVNTNVDVVSITCGAHTGTLDFSAHNNNVNLSSSFSGTGTGVRTLNLGNGTWTINVSTAIGAVATVWAMGQVTNLTFNANSSTVAFTGTIGGRQSFQGGGLTYNVVAFGAVTTGWFSFTGSNTFSTLTLTGPNFLSLANGTQTITTLNLNGTSGSEVSVAATALGSATTILTITTLNATWAAFRDIIGSGTATSSFDLGNNSGITITPPASGSTGYPASRVSLGM